MSAGRGCAVLVLVFAFAFSPAAVASTGGETSFKTVTVKAAGISLQYPRKWTALRLTKKDIADTINGVRKTNPELAQHLQSIQNELAQGLVFTAAIYGTLLRTRRSAA
jgi:hypothetical protein